MKKIVLKLFPKFYLQLSHFKAEILIQLSHFKAEILIEYKEMRKEGKSVSLCKSIFYYFLYGASVSEAAFFHFDELNNKGKRSFVTMRKNRKLDAMFNDAFSNKILWNKASFNTHFSCFIKRPFLLVDQSVSNNQLSDLLCVMGGVGVAKPNNLYYGLGIKKVSSLDDLLSLRDSGKSYLVEKLLTNHPELDRFNNSSLNTFRVVTCIDSKGEVHIVTISLRTGRKGILVDNLHHGGVGWHIDLETGVIDYPGRDVKGNYFIAHPTSGMIGLGFKIPHFLELKQFAIVLAEHLPGARYVGWDIAITPDSVEVIEGNVCPGADATQCNNKGLFKKIYSYY